MKRLLVFTLTVCLCLGSAVSVFAQSPLASIADEDPAAQLKQELLEVFPDQTDVIEGIAYSEIATVSEPVVTQTLEGENEYSEYHLEVYSDGSYLASRMSILDREELVGGTEVSGTGYTGKDNCSISVLKFFGLNDEVYVTVYPISYRIYTNGYDQITEASEIGSASRINLPGGVGQVEIYSVHKNMESLKETASKKAYAKYWIGPSRVNPEFFLWFVVGNNSWQIIFSRDIAAFV